MTNIIKILEFFSQHDMHDELYWHVKDDIPSFYVICNDLFYWACADAEEIDATDLQNLEKAIQDLEKVDKTLGLVHATDLWACRKRKMRPQTPAYPKNNKFHPLFDACGPERTRKDQG